MNKTFTCALFVCIYVHRYVLYLLLTKIWEKQKQDAEVLHFFT